MDDTPDRRDSGQVEVISEQREDGTYEIRVQSKEVDPLDDAELAALRESRELDVAAEGGGSAGVYAALIAVLLLLGLGAWLLFVSPQSGRDRDTLAQGDTVVTESTSPARLVRPGELNRAPTERPMMRRSEGSAPTESPRLRNLRARDPTMRYSPPAERFRPRERIEVQRAAPRQFEITPVGAGYSRGRRHDAGLGAPAIDPGAASHERDAGLGVAAAPGEEDEAAGSGAPERGEGETAGLPDEASGPMGDEEHLLDDELEEGRDELGEGEPPWEDEAEAQDDELAPGAGLHPEDDFDEEVELGDDELYDEDDELYDEDGELLVEEDDEYYDEDDEYYDEDDELYGEDDELYGEDDELLPDEYEPEDYDEEYY
jgi:hypothetical protein